MTAHIHNLKMFRQRETAEASASPTVMDTARVIRRDNGEFLLVTPDTMALRGRKAAGCLLEPEENDTVLIVRNLPGGVYILTVLERGDAPERIVLRGDATLCAEGGNLRLAGMNVVVAGEQAATMEAPEIKLHGVRGEAVFADLSVTASVAEAKAGRLSLVASTIDTIAVRITQKAKDCFRWVSRVDSTRAGQVSVRAERRFDVKADAVSLLADADVKIDGDKISLG